MKIASDYFEERVWEPSRKLNTKKIQQIRAERRREGVLGPAYKTASPQKSVDINVHTADGITRERVVCGVRVKSND